MEPSSLSYGIGPLLYCPASNGTVADSVLNEKFGSHFSLALCLEDTIDDNCVEEAETILLNTLQLLQNALQRHEYYLPKIFIRVRTPEQMVSLYSRMKSSRNILTGFIAPKFALDNADNYKEKIEQINSSAPAKVSMMPILESPTMIHLQNRYDILYGLKDKLDGISDLIPNVRVGGNDLCHTFGFRRQSTQTIYDVMPVASILSDIMTVFGMDYVISGPVWEYYNGFHWDEGLAAEIRKDRLNGFVGKTVIHPKQIELVNKGYMVSKEDYEDARSILNWDTGSHLMVSGNSTSDRMNEYKTHFNWAKKVMGLAMSYGVLE